MAARMMDDYRRGLAEGERDARAEAGPLPTSPVVPGSAMYQAGYRNGRAKVRNERHLAAATTTTTND